MIRESNCVFALSFDKTKYKQGHLTEIISHSDCMNEKVVPELFCLLRNGIGSHISS